MNAFRLSCVAGAALLLVACGGSDDPVRGSLIDTPVVVTTLSAAQINAGTAASGPGDQQVRPSATSRWWP
jgi:hypothetical protein